MSPTHPDLDPVWERMQDLGVPFVLHLGGSPMFLRRGFAKNGRTTERGALADDIRAKEYATIHFGPEAFMSAMILDVCWSAFRDCAAEVSSRALFGWCRGCANWISRKPLSRASNRI